MYLGFVGGQNNDVAILQHKPALAAAALHKLSDEPGEPCNGSGATR